MHPKKLVAAVIICGSGLACLASTSGAASDPTAEVPTAAQTASLTPSETNLLTSGAPIDVVMDPATGDVLSVSNADTGAIADISIRSVCDSGDGCYETNTVPYADEGFYGSAGTKTGSWPYRSGYSSGNYTVSACYSGGCGVEIAPNSELAFTSDVTGTSFTIY
jgi:hypothetical protein